MSTSEFAGPALTGFLVSLAASILIAATKRWHGRFSFDTHSGPQKIHDTPTPRIGGLALYAGLLAAAASARPPLRELLLAPAIGSAIAFAAGLAEDLTKKVSATVRLLATMLSGVVFCIVTGYAVTRLDFALVDGLMALPLVSIAFTVFVMAGLTNAFNIIDGFHGLAAGTAIIMLCALAALAFLSGDPGLAWAAVVVAAVLAGFLAVNFPFGYVFLGDGGAYVAGLLPGTLGIALAARNPEISVWAVAVVLAYPVLETVFSITRKTIRSGHSPGRPDEMHLHHLVYRRLGGRLARTTPGGPASERLANPTTSAVMWGGAATGLIFVLALPHTRGWALLALAALAALYATLYRLLASPDGSRAPGSGDTRPPSRSRVGPEGCRRGEGVSRNAACGPMPPARPGRGPRP